jgi:hypothetical protein
MRIHADLDSRSAFSGLGDHATFVGDRGVGLTQPIHRARAENQVGLGRMGSAAGDSARRLQKRHRPALYRSDTLWQLDENDFPFRALIRFVQSMRT